MARVCAQCLFTAGGKDSAGIGCHSPCSALQKRKESMTFNLPPFSLPLCPCPTCSGSRRESRAVGLMLPATKNGRVEEHGEQARGAVAQTLVLLAQRARRQRRSSTEKNKKIKKKRRWICFIPFPSKAEMLRATIRHLCSYKERLLQCSFRAGCKTLAPVEPHLLTVPFLLIFGDSFPVDEQHERCSSFTIKHINVRPLKHRQVTLKSISKPERWVKQSC